MTWRKMMMWLKKRWKGLSNLIQAVAIVPTVIFVPSYLGTVILPAELGFWWSMLFIISPTLVALFAIAYICVMHIEDWLEAWGQSDEPDDEEEDDTARMNQLMQALGVQSYKEIDRGFYGLEYEKDTNCRYISVHKRGSGFRPIYAYGLGGHPCGYNTLNDPILTDDFIRRLKK